MRKLSDTCISWKLHPPHSMEMTQISDISMYKRNPWKFQPLIPTPALKRKQRTTYPTKDTQVSIFLRKWKAKVRSTFITELIEF